MSGEVASPAAGLADWLIDKLTQLGVSCTPEEAAEFAKTFEAEMERQLRPVIESVMLDSYNMAVDSAVALCEKFGQPGLLILRLQGLKMKDLT